MTELLDRDSRVRRYGFIKEFSVFHSVSIH
jgi:hypothetical protein